MKSITVPTEAGERHYLFHAPVGFDQPLPLVLMLHGTGGTAKFAAEETRLDEFGEQVGFATAYPEGLPVNPALPARFLTNPQRWNDGATKPGDLLHTRLDDVAYLTSVIQDALVRGPCDPQRVYITGFSNGAGMAFRLAAERAELIAAMAPVAGYCHVKEPRPVPTLYLIGDADPLIPMNGGPVRVPWGNRVIQRPRIEDNLANWRDAVKGAEFVMEIIPGLGHHWPGGMAQLNPRIGGPPVDTVNANEKIWEFLKRHRL
jgi:polyhydroxybutyrate depolymerase